MDRKKYNQLLRAKRTKKEQELRRIEKEGITKNLPLSMKEIDGHEGYFISQDGKIFSVHNNRYLKPYINKRGYAMRGFYIKSTKKFKNIQIHRLVAMAFIPNPLSKPFVNHLNGIRHDNRVENLEWCTAKENIIHSWNNGLSKLTQKMIETNCRKIVNIKTGDEYKSMIEAAKKCGIKYHTLSGHLSRKKFHLTDLRYKDE